MKRYVFDLWVASLSQAGVQAQLVGWSQRFPSICCG